MTSLFDLINSPYVHIPRPYGFSDYREFEYKGYKFWFKREGFWFTRVLPLLLSRLKPSRFKSVHGITLRRVPLKEILFKTFVGGKYKGGVTDLNMKIRGFGYNYIYTACRQAIAHHHAILNPPELPPISEEVRRASLNSLLSQDGPCK